MVKSKQKDFCTFWQSSPLFLSRSQMLLGICYAVFPLVPFPALEEHDGTKGWACSWFLLHPPVYSPASPSRWQQESWRPGIALWGLILTFSWGPHSHSLSGGLELKPKDEREEIGDKIIAGTETLVPLSLYHVTSHPLPFRGWPKNQVSSETGALGFSCSPQVLFSAESSTLWWPPQTSHLHVCRAPGLQRHASLLQKFSFLWHQGWETLESQAVL